MDATPGRNTRALRSLPDPLRSGRARQIAESLDRNERMGSGEVLGEWHETDCSVDWSAETGQAGRVTSIRERPGREVREEFVLQGEYAVDLCQAARKEWRYSPLTDAVVCLTFLVAQNEHRALIQLAEDTLHALVVAGVLWSRNCLVVKRLEIDCEFLEDPQGQGVRVLVNGTESSPF